MRNVEWIRRKNEEKEKERLKNSIKYQVINDLTCLYAEIELEEKVGENMEKIEINEINKGIKEESKPY